MKVIPVPCLADNYAYLIVAGGGALVVDPSEEAPVTAALAAAGLRPLALLCTHHHYDHVGGVEELLARTPGLPVLGHESDAQKGRIPRQSEALRDGEERELGGLRLRALHVPGHTLGALAYHFPDGEAVFTGDTLFGAGCGRLFEGTPELMEASLARLGALPPATRVFFGHEYTAKNLDFAAAVEPGSAAVAARQEACGAARAAGRPTTPSTIAEERESNPFLRSAEPAVRARAQALEPSLPAEAGPAAVLGAIRRWKDRF